MSIENAIKKAEEVARIYNPNTLIPFPFEKIEQINNDLEIKIGQMKDDDISGLLDYRNVEGVDKFRIFVNSAKPRNRIYFTLAHEIGHYFLHKDVLKKQGLVVDDGEMLEMFRHDNALSTEEEKEANNFAATLIMPQDKVAEIWFMLKDISKCADFFQVSVLAMSIRLNKLKLID